MFESFLILLAGGVLLAAAAVPRPADLRPTWLRLAGVVALASSALGAALAAGRGNLVATPPFFRRVQAALVGITLVCAVVQLVCVQRGALRAARVVGFAGFVVAVLAGSNLLHDAMLTRGTAVTFPPKGFAMALQTLSAAGAASAVGFALMTAAFPLCGTRAAADDAAAAAAAGSFRRLYRGLVIAVALRAAVAVGGVLLLQSARPVSGLWANFGLLIPARWLAGLVAVPLLATLARGRLAAGNSLSGTALLLAAAMLAADAEALALYLVRETGLPL